MNCEAEENQLGITVKQAGPPPHLDPAAYLGSWKALEEAYSDKNNTIASIGVSNFDLNELKALEKSATVLPHILQDNVWNVLFNPHILQYCRQKRILYQVYNVMSGIVSRIGKAPHASRVFGSSGARVLQWLVQQKIAVIPRTVKHVSENSPTAIAGLLRLTDQQLDEVRAAIKAL